MSKKVNDEMVKVRNASKAEKQKNREIRNKKRAAALEAKGKAKAEATEKGLPWNDAIPAARFIEDYDAAFMSAVAGEAKTGEPVNPDVVAGVNQNPEADQTPAPTEKTSAQLTMEAARAAMLGTANDNEEPEAPTVTGVPVMDNEEDKSGLVPAIDLADPSTWPLEVNGGLMRLPGESNKKFSNRKHKHKLWRREQDKLTETRNGEPPAEEGMDKMYPTGQLVYNSDEDGQSVQPVKSEQANEPATDTPAEEQAEQVPAEEVAQPKPAEENTAPEHVVQEEVVITPNKPVEAKPTLTLASSQSEDEALIGRAQKFYGSTWTEERAEKLTKAFKFLEMAIRLQQKGESESRINMPMTSAIRLETEALGIAFAKAA